MKVTSEMVSAALLSLRRTIEREAWPTVGEVRAALEAAIAAAPAAPTVARVTPEAWSEAQPVAWRVRRTGDERYELFFDHATAVRRGECFVPSRPAEPLYATPPALIAAAREALEAMKANERIYSEPAGFAGKWGSALDRAISEQQVKIDAARASAQHAIAFLRAALDVEGGR